MKKNDLENIFAKDIKELRKSLWDARDMLSELKVDNKQFKIKNTRQIFHKRKEIAKILTAMREKELAVK